jgi:hypothetical protein
MASGLGQGVRRGVGPVAAADMDHHGKLLYIAGAGRSGSTMLDIILGNHPDVVSAGEVNHLVYEWSDPTVRCACGHPYATCPFWRDLFQSEGPDPETIRVVRMIEHAAFLPRLVTGQLGFREREIYRYYAQRVNGYIRERAGKPILVDSSKTLRPAAGRFLALRRLAGESVYVIHFVRSGLSTMESRLGRGVNPSVGEDARGRSADRTPAKVVGAWVQSNMVASVLGPLVGRERYVRLRYEDFIADPAATLRRIGDVAGFDASALAERAEQGREFVVGHLTRGNRVRFENSIRITRQTLRRARLTSRQRLIFAIEGGWLQYFYGYREGATGS